MLQKSNNLNSGFAGFLKKKSFTKKFISSSLTALFMSYLIVLLALGGCSNATNGSVSESEQDYTITFDTGGGSSIEEVKVGSGETLTKPIAGPTSNNYSFVGWYSDEELTEAYNFSNVVTNSFTLYAKWDKIIYTITFDTGGGSSIAEVKVDSGETLTKPIAGPTSNNYSFVGWYSDEELTEAYNFSSAVTNSFTLYAKWDKIIYTITFDTGGGSSIAEAKVVSGETLTKPIAGPISNNYSFVGWYSDEDLTEAYNFSNAVTNSFTLYAKWDKIIYTITFDTGGGSSIAEVKIDSGETLTKPIADPTSNNYSFVGWYSDEELTEAYNFSSAVTNSFTLYAKWGKIIYTITFDTGGGSSIEEVKVVSGETLTKPIAGPTSNNYSFVGWYSDEGLTEAYNFSNAVTNSFTLYAKWGKTIYTITFDTGGGSSIAEVKVDSGETLTKPIAGPTSNNYSFVGWYSDEGLTEAYNFSNAVTNSFTLYAKWGKIIYTITFDTGGGSSIAEAKVVSGETLTKPIAGPISNNYSFVGWYSDEGLTEAYNFSNVVTNNFTLYAKWDKIHTVTFSTGEGSSVNPVKVTNGNTLTKPTSPTPVNSDFAFAEWHSNTLLTGRFDFSQAILSDITLYAAWGSTSMMALSNIMEEGRIPSDRTTYTSQVQEVLSQFSGTPTVNFRYVKQGGTGNGLSWEDAHGSPKDIINGISGSIGNVYFVLVASGTYTPNQMAMKNHVAIIGGWDTAGGWTRFLKTIFDGKNLYQVFRNRLSLDNTALLYEATIANGKSSEGGGMYNSSSSPSLMNVTFYQNRATTSYSGGGGLFNDNASPFLSNVTFLENTAPRGAGMYNNGSSPILVKVNFDKNTATDFGGGMYNYNSSSPSLKNVTFSGNKVTSVYNSKGRGGGMYNYNSSSPSLKNVTFSNNVVTKLGGGIYNDNSSPYLKNVTFVNNRGGSAGGGIYNYNSSPILVNTTFSGNQATSSSGNGGGIYNYLSSSVKLVNVTLYKNTAGAAGGGIYSSGNTSTSGPFLVNTLLWGNEANSKSNQIFIDNRVGTTPTQKLYLHYSLIEGGDDLSKGVVLSIPSASGSVSYVHTHNIAGDPLLGSLSDNGGNVFTHALGQNSPAINAGIYVKKSGSTLYFSTNETSWYTNFNDTGFSGTETLTSNLPSNTEDINDTDARGHVRTLPDIGAYEKN